MCLIQLLLLLLVPGLSNGNLNCLTWSINKTDLILTCRTNNFSLPVTFIDPFGKEQGKCSFNRSMANCLSFLKNSTIRANSKKNQVVLVIKDLNKFNVNGEWTCTEGLHRRTTVVQSKGLLNSTDVHIEGYIQSDDNVIALKCVSCREPELNTVEFLINNRSADIMRYIPLTTKCLHSKGKCHPNTCTCSKSGSEFIRIFPYINNATFSCEMKFSDDIGFQRFQKIATLVFNGTGFTKLPTITEITNVGNINDDKNGNKSKPTEPPTSTGFQTGKWIGIAVFCALVLFVIILIIVYCIQKQTREDYYTKKLHVTESKTNYVNDVKEKRPLIEIIDNSGGKNFVNEETQTFQLTEIIDNSGGKDFVNEGTQTFQLTGEAAVTNMQREYSMQDDFELIQLEKKLEITVQDKEKLQKRLQTKKVKARLEKVQAEVAQLKKEEMSFDAKYSSSITNVKTLMTKEKVGTIQSIKTVVSAMRKERTKRSRPMYSSTL